LINSKSSFPNIALATPNDNEAKLLINPFQSISGTTKKTITVNPTTLSFPIVVKTDEKISNDQKSVDNKYSIENSNIGGNKKLAISPIANPIDINKSSVEFKNKIRKLNTSFSQWIQKQINQNPKLTWKDGVKVSRFKKFKLT